MSDDFRSSLPPRVGAALGYVEMMSNKELGRKGSWEEAAAAVVELSKLERAAYDSALKMLNQYFTGEMDFDPSPRDRRRPSDDEDPPATRIPAGIRP